MSLFGQRKNKDSQASILSEGEIQKRLYGEFKKDPTRVAGAGERETVAVTPSAPTKAPAAEITPDLFTPAKETAENAGQTGPTVVSREIKISESLTRPVITKPVERKVQPTSTPVTSSHPYQRYRELNKAAASQKNWYQGFLDALKNAGSFWSGFLDSNQFLTRQVLYWTGGVLAVFFLFWSVNALNVRREQAMHVKPKLAAPVSTAVVSESRSRQETIRPETQSTESVPEGVAVPPARQQTFSARKAVFTPPTTAGAVSSGRFVIQVVMYPSEDYTTSVVASLKQAGFKAFVKESIRPSGATLYAVLIGGFRTAAEARQQLAKFRSSEVARPFADAFVRTME